METKKVTITLPYISVLNALQNFATNLKQLSSTVLLQTDHAYRSFQNTSSRGKVSFMNFLKSPNLKNKFRNFSGKKLLLAVLPVIGIVILITVITQSVRSQPKKDSVLAADATTNTDFLKSTKPLNKTFSFPLKNEAGKSIGTFSFEVQNAELRNQILVRGQKATAVKGRTFMIVNLKLKNELKQGLQINTRDYVRLSVNKNKTELLAPDIHNDPVEVQAISTKYTRVGFAINDTDKNIVLIIGEIDGTKTDIPLSF